MSQRFFVSSPIDPQTHVTLDGPEAHHLLHVMRGKVGDAVVLFDGSGCDFPSTIEKLGRHEVLLRVDERLERDRELPVELVLAVALPRGDRQEWLVEKAVELGVAELVPWQTQRSVALPNDKTLARLHRGVVEACKQCGRNRLMQIHSPVTFADYLAMPTANVRVPAANILVHPTPSALPLDTLIAPTSGTSLARICIGVGPEGGFTDQEIADGVAAGWKLASLGPTILRTETAALTAASIARK